MAELEKEFARIIHELGDPENFGNQARDLISSVDTRQRATDDFLSKQAADIEALRGELQRTSK